MSCFSEEICLEVWKQGKQGIPDCSLLLKFPSEKLIFASRMEKENLALHIEIKYIRKLSAMT